LINVAIVDDHELMCQTISSFINNLDNYRTACMAKNGYELLLCLQQLKQLPNIAIIDVNMPIMDGIQITKILYDHFSEINVLGISITSSSNFIYDMLDAGAKGFLNKNNMDIYLSQALQTIASGKIFVEPNHEYELECYLKKENMSINRLNEFEFSKNQMLYLQLNASELDYKSIASIMHVSEKSLHNYHDSIKEKTGASTRLGQALFAFKRGLINNEGWFIF
jgi:DNA-binding NarL/FixJ family response regulator